MNDDPIAEELHPSRGRLLAECNGDLDTALRVGRRLDASAVMVNDHTVRACTMGRPARRA